ncbi:MAG: hypothetical protein ABEH43_11815 [Flavobacteriales bacterium]
MGPNEKCCSNDTCDKLGKWKQTNVYPDSRKTLKITEGNYEKISARETPASSQASNLIPDQCYVNIAKYEWKTAKYNKGIRINYDKEVACSNLVKFKSEFSKTSGPHCEVVYDKQVDFIHDGTETATPGGCSSLSGLQGTTPYCP